MIVVQRNVVFAFLHFCDIAFLLKILFSQRRFSCFHFLLCVLIFVICFFRNCRFLYLMLIQEELKVWNTIKKGPPSHNACIALRPRTHNSWSLYQTWPQSVSRYRKQQQSIQAEERRTKSTETWPKDTQAMRTCPKLGTLVNDELLEDLWTFLPECLRKLSKRFLMMIFFLPTFLTDSKYRTKIDKLKTKQNKWTKTNSDKVPENYHHIWISNGTWLTTTCDKLS